MPEERSTIVRWALTECEFEGVRQQLRKLLPPYMLPSRWQVMTSLPKKSTARLTGETLRELFSAEPDQHDTRLSGRRASDGARDESRR